MRIPSAVKIINRALDQRADATNQHDAPTVKALDQLISNLYRGMKAKWDASGDLLVTSCNHVGAIYTVSQRSCTCPAFVAYCVHQRLRDLLLEMFSTDVESADIDSDPPGEPSPLGDEEGDEAPEWRAVWPRVAAARRSLIWQAL